MKLSELEMIEVTKEIYEREGIINMYTNQGIIDRQDVINRYVKFNQEHPEYVTALNLSAAINNNLINVAESSNDILMNNFSQQLRYLEGKLIGKTMDKLLNSI